MRKNSDLMVFGRRGFLTGVGATLISAAVSAQTVSALGIARAAGRLSLHVGSGIGRSHIRMASFSGHASRLSHCSLSGGMPQRPVLVRWQIALDENMRKVVRRGAALASLPRSRTLYTWRWTVCSRHAGIGTSSKSQAKSATSLARARRPRTDGAERQLAFAFASCQNYVNGFFPAYWRMAEEDIDFVVHLGDYIYEGAGGAGVRAHLPAAEIMTLEDYRDSACAVQV